MILNDKLFNILKWICMVGLPAIGVLWYTLGKIWGFPYLEEVNATIIAVVAFLGALLGISNIRYYARLEAEDGKSDNDQQ